MKSYLYDRTKAILSQKVILGVVLLAGWLSASPGSNAANTPLPIYRNTAYSFKERAADLVSRMTLEEKQSQLGNTMPPIPRLGVKKYDVWGEALHGVVGRNDNSGMTATSFPNSVAMGCAWDPELTKRETQFIADEARGFNHNYIFTLTYWSPVVEPTRDPRWGRTAETFAEDPFLVSSISSGFVRGLMGDDPTYLKAVPCGKHFFANNTEYNRHTGSANMDDRDMREFYLFPYKSLIQKDKLPSIMTAYSAVNGVPMSASRFLVDTIARKTYGMDGYVTGDCDAVSDILNGHHYAKTRAEAAAMALKTGVDSDCGSIYQNNALDALRQGLIVESDIDKALINLFTIRMRLGEFDPQNLVPYAGIKPDVVNDPSHNDLALEIATKTPVLLKNALVARTGRKALPLRAEAIRKIAVLGTQADKVELGDYSGEIESKYRITPLQGITNYLAQNHPSTQVVSKSGGNTLKRTDFFTVAGFSTVNKDGTGKTVDATKFDASSAGLITSARFGAASVRGIKDGDWTAYNNIDITNLDSLRLNMSVSGDGGVLEVRVGSVTGNILASKKLAPSAPSGNPMGGFGGGGRSTPISVKINTLGISGPQTLVLVYRDAEVPATDKETLDMAASADVAVVFVGTDQSTGREESDRFSITLPGNQSELIRSISAVNPNTIVVIQGMGMVEIEAIKNNPNIAGVVFTGYNGQAQGAAIAKILFGEVNPGGKTSVTWYKSLNDLPDFNDYTLRASGGKKGRTYMYFNGDVSYEFGYGLSYTTFEYSNFRINRKAFTPNDKVTVSVDVKNTGAMDGDEIVQIYVKTPDSPSALERPIKRLKGFQRVTIAKGQTKTVSIDINASDLWFWDATHQRLTFDPGNYVFEVGASSKDIKGTVSATLSGAYRPVLATVVAESDQTVLRPGKTAKTSVTASLSDDSFYDIRKATVRYTSNNAAVASVDANGIVTALSAGTATISAEVTVDGVTVSNGFPVKVMPDLTPLYIKVNGKQPASFDPTVKAYGFLLKKGEKAPVITAAAMSKSISVVVEQAASVPGTAVVRFVDTNTAEVNTYCFNFDTQALSDDFNGTTLGKQWQWVRENPSTHSLTQKPGMLTLTTEPGDVSEASNNAKNLLLQSANNDWVAQTHMVCSRVPSQPENAGLIAYQDDNNFVKLMLRAVTKTTRQGRGPGAVQPGTIDLVVEENGIAKSAGSFNLNREITGNTLLTLKLEKKGALFTAYYSLDGTTFQKLGTATSLLKNSKVGLMACDGVIIQSMKNTFWFNPDTTKPDTPFDVSFDDFRIENLSAQ
jgi:beta-glucosidase-like glycosyl hydrolase